MMPLNDHDDKWWEENGPSTLTKMLVAVFLMGFFAALAAYITLVNL
jgi:hypothetical protein